MSPPRPLPEAARARHAGYLKSAQNSDGGFSGREGDSDLYYTAFALRGLLHLLPEHFLPVASVPLDGRVLAFTAAAWARFTASLR